MRWRGSLGLTSFWHWRRGFLESSNRILKVYEQVSTTLALSVREVSIPTPSSSLREGHLPFIGLALSWRLPFIVFSMLCLQRFPLLLPFPTTLKTRHFCDEPNNNITTHHQHQPKITFYVSQWLEVRYLPILSEN